MVLSTVRHQPNGGKLPWTVFKLFSDTFSYRELKLYSKFRAKFEPLQIIPEIIWKSTNMTYICQDTTLLSLFLAFRHVKCGKINLTSWKPGQIIITTTIIIISIGAYIQGLYALKMPENKITMRKILYLSLNLYVRYVFKPTQ